MTCDEPRCALDGPHAHDRDGWAVPSGENEPTIPAATLDLFLAVKAAEVQARHDHDTGRCQDSEWSCSYCEQPGSSRVDVG